MSCKKCGKNGHNSRTCKKEGIYNPVKNKDSNKKQIINELYEKFGVNNEFSNKEIRDICGKYTFGNPNDIVKLDYLSSLPNELQSNAFLFNLGSGKYTFIEENLYREKPIINEEEIEIFYIKDWEITKFSKSENTFLGNLDKHGLLNKYFISSGKNLYFIGRVREFNFEYSYINGKIKKMNKCLQIELDGLFISKENQICCPIEVKSDKQDRYFNPFQLYNPYRKLKESGVYKNYNIFPTYIVRGDFNKYVEIYAFEFRNIDLNSLTLIDKRKFILQ